MKEPAKSILIYVSLALTSALAIYFFFRVQQLKGEIQLIELSKDSSQEDAWMKQTIGEIDSLLLKGDYTKAAEAYLALDTIYKEYYGEDISWRSQLAISLSKREQRLLERKDQTDSASAKDISFKTEEKASSLELRKYDSLTFVIEKANLKIKHLRRQIEERSEGDYLSFSTSKGKKLYYVGEVKNKKANGRGIAILVSGSRYQGEWKDNMRHGEGVFNWPDGQYYVGSYKKDMRHGKGTYYWPNGERYVGQWENDQRNGQGTFFGADSKVVTGTWKKDKLAVVNKGEQ